MVGKVEPNTKYGQVTTVKQTEGRDKGGRVLWDCLCDCGKATTISSRHLLGGFKQHCGCAKKVYGQGLVEKGRYKVSTPLGKGTREYSSWLSLLTRCYSKSFLERRPTYLGCTVSENFKNFQYFAEWCNQQTGFGNKGWQLDKDILSNGEKIYSENNCVYVPPKLNMFVVSRSLNPEAVGTNITDRGTFAVNISIEGKTKYFGEYPSLEEAVEVYKEQKKLRLEGILSEYSNLIDPRIAPALLKLYP